MSEIFISLASHPKRSEAAKSRGVTEANQMACLDFTRHSRCSPPNRNHFAAGLVIVAKIVCPRLSIDHVKKKVLQLLIARALPQLVP